jgi:hypothetical protein
MLRQIQETLAEHGRLLRGLSSRTDELASHLAKTADLGQDAMRHALAGVKRSATLVRESENRDRVQSESGGKLDELMAELEKLPPEELRRQIEAANALLGEEPACQRPF